MRGRKKKENSKTKVVSIRVTDPQYDVIKKNDWIRKEVIKRVEEYLNIYLTNDK